MSDNDENKIVDQIEETVEETAEETVKETAEEIKLETPEEIKKAVDEVKEAVTEKTEEEEDKVEQVEAQLPKSNDSKKPSNKLMYGIIGAAAAAVLIIAIIIISSLGGGKSTSKMSVTGFSDEDGKGYVLDGKGGVIEVADDVTFCFITADKKHVAYIDDDDKLYVANGKAKNPEKVAKNVESAYYLRNDGFLYSTTDKEYYRYSYSKKDAVKLGNVEDFYVSTDDSDEINVAYFEDGKLYLLANNSTEPEKIAKGDGCYINYVSEDGKTVVWTEKGDGEKLHITTAKEDLKVIKSDETITVRIYANGKKILAFDGDNKLYNLDINGKVISETKIKDGYAYLSTVYTSKGVLEYETKSLSSFYVSIVKEDGTKAVYYIDGKGEATEIVDDASVFAISNGKIYFLDGDNIKTAKVGKEKIKKAEKIYKDISTFNYIEESGYLLMLGTDGELLCAKPGKDAVEVSDNAKNVTLSKDSKTIYFVEDVKDDNGTLMSYKLGAKDAVEIADDVYSGIIETGTPDGEITSNSFYVFQKSSKKKHALIYVKGTKIKEVVDGFKLTD